MKSRKRKANKHTDSMRSLSHPAKGLERDSKGKPIPMKKRLNEDRAEARAAAKRKTRKVKKKKK
ncbi:MAG TPA: hypothetical protein VID67_08060 [Rhizomicrobium sp.]|jgi:hypothetical protein